MTKDEEDIKQWLEDIGVRQLSSALENGQFESFEAAIATVRLNPLRLTTELLDRGVALGVIRVET